MLSVIVLVDRELRLVEARQLRPILGKHPLDAREGPRVRISHVGDDLHDRPLPFGGPPPRNLVTQPGREARATTGTARSALSHSSRSLIMSGTQALGQRKRNEQEGTKCGDQPEGRHDGRCVAARRHPLHRRTRERTTWMKALEVAELITSGPIRVGSQFREVQSAGGARIETICEVVEWDGETRYAWKSVSEGPVRYGGGFTAIPIEGGTELRYEGWATTTGPLANREKAWARQAQREAEAELAAIKDALEGAQPDAGRENLSTR